MPLKYQYWFDPEFWTFLYEGCSIYHGMTFIWGALSQGSLIYMISYLELETFQVVDPIKDTKFQGKPVRMEF